MLAHTDALMGGPKGIWVEQGGKREFGNVEIGEGTHIGSGAIVIPNVVIGKWAVIGAGAVIIKDVPDYAVVVGNPGKIIKYNEK